jgi:hypothetical protein
MIGRGPRSPPKHRSCIHHGRLRATAGDELKVGIFNFDGHRSAKILPMLVPMRDIVKRD